MTRFKGLTGQSTIARYLFIGVSGFVFEMLVLFLSSNILGLSSALSVTLSYWLGLLFSFTFQKIFAFENRDYRLKTLSVQGVAYLLLVLVNYLFTLGFTLLTAPILGVYASRTIALAITTSWNFFLYKKVIFKSSFTNRH